jgi:hypothetical protein
MNKIKIKKNKRSPWSRGNRNNEGCEELKMRIYGPSFWKSSRELTSLGEFYVKDL